MPIELFDTHCHLDAEAFDEDREATIKKAKSAGITRILNVGASRDLVSVKDAIKLAESYDFIWASAGIHPHDAGGEHDLEELKTLASNNRVVAIGETGLDFFKEWSPVDAQHKWFRLQIELAKELRKPLIIHCRSAFDECYRTLKELDIKDIGAVFHCFSEDWESAKKVFDLNCMISFPGILTFKNASITQEVAKQAPTDRIMLETDAPYLAPHPYRGKRAEPAHVLETARKLAELRNQTLEEIAATTTENALRFFRL